jgi:hypothetical protein
MIRAALAGLAYFGVVFATGFGLGTIRVLVLAPTLGEIAAVLIELPIILVVSWVACRWLITRFDVQNLVSARLVMGGIALAVLLFAEIGVSVFGFGRSLSAHLEQYRQLPVLIGLAGQVAFASFPIIQRMSGVDRRAS